MGNTSVFPAWQKVIFFCLVVAFIGITASCGGSGTGTGAPPPQPTPLPETCERSALAADLDHKLASLTTDTDFTFHVQFANGEAYAYSRGDSRLDTSYESASTSKWVAAVAILWLVDQGVLNLEDAPGLYLSDEEWPLPTTDPLATTTLRQLLSFTSGFNKSAFCLNRPNADFFNCVTAIAQANAEGQAAPGAEFDYGSSHLQIAGAMAVRAGGYETWQNLFDDFRSTTGLFAQARFNLPSEKNPRLAGGMTWTAEEYLAFLGALVNGSLLSEDLQTEMTRDQISEATIVNSPARSGIGQDWHYGFGVWLECDSVSYDCGASTDYLSSPGAYGAYPFINRSQNFFGIVARQGELGSFPEGFAVFDAVRDKVETMANCD